MEVRSPGRTIKCPGAQASSPAEKEVRSPCNSPAPLAGRGQGAGNL
ncbi:MAG: hypothetical protein ACI30J_06925 [Paludibacteraceae bacterium]